MSAGNRDYTDAKGEVVPPKASGGGDSTDAIGERVPSRQTPVLTEQEYESERYKMDYPKRGTVVIINNTEFSKMNYRGGSNADAEKMKNMFISMGFTVNDEGKNLKAPEIKDLLTKVAKDDFTDQSCFVCIILSYGEEGLVYGVGGENDKVSMNDLMQLFKGEECKSLITKPKLFFVQACPPVAITQHDASTESNIVDIRRIPTEADFLMAFSVLPSSKKDDVGSWFIKSIYDVFTDNWKQMDVLSMMTRVNKKIDFDFHNNDPDGYEFSKHKVACITSMLTKLLYLG